MRIKSIFLMLCVLFLGIGCSKLEENSAFYYSQGKKQYLDERKDVIYLVFEKGLSEERKKEITRIISGLKPYVYYPRANYMQPSIYDGTNSDYAVLQSSGFISRYYLSLYKSEKGVLRADYVFSSSSGYYFGCANSFIIKLHDEADYSTLKELLDKYGCKIDDRPYMGHNTYVIELTPACKHSPLKMSQIFHELGIFEFSSPNFVYFHNFLDV